MIEILGEHTALIETLRIRDVMDDAERESSGEQERADRQRPSALWLDATASPAEECLTLMRHVSHPHPALRARALLVVGKLRLRRFQVAWKSPRGGRTSTAASDLEGKQDDDSKNLAYDENNLHAAACEALKAALRVSWYRGGHDWGIMVDACMTLVELNASPISPQAHMSSHYLRLAASISSARRRFNLELDAMASKPLPQEVVNAMPRSALDELAGRSGRGPEDDPSRLDTRSLLQFLRNSVKERSLATAPADLLPACTVCQIHALLQQYFAPYRERCCIDASALIEPPPEEDRMKTDAGIPTGLVCVQWTCNASCTSSNGFVVKDSTIANAMGGHLSSKDRSLPKQGKDGLYPTRMGVILLGPHAVESELMQGKPSEVNGRDSSIMILLRLNAATAAKLKRTASQLKVLLKRWTEKVGRASLAPTTVKHRIDELLMEFRNAVTSGLVDIPFAKSVITDRDPALEQAHAKVVDNSLDVTVESLDHIASFFDAEVGLDVEDEGFCRFVRSCLNGKV